MTELTTVNLQGLQTPLQKPNEPLRTSSEGKDRFKQLLITCCAIYPMYNKTPDDLTIMFKAFVEFLGAYDAQTVIDVLVQHIKTESNFPTIADIHKKASRGSMSGMFG